MLQLRRMTLGDHFRAVIVCPACDAKMDVDFEAEEVPIEREEPLYSEKSLRLRSYWCYQPSPDAPAVVAPPCLASGHVLYPADKLEVRDHQRIVRLLGL